MRVTFILPGLDLTGGNRVVSIYARLLSQTGHRVLTVVAGPHKRSWRQRLLDLMRSGRIKQKTSVSKSHFDGLGLDIKHIDTWRPIIDADLPDADVVIATWWETAEWVAALSSSKGKKVYFVQGHEIFDHQPLERVRATYHSALRKIVVAPWLQEIMAQEYGDTRVELVPNAVDHDIFFAPVRHRQVAPTVGFMYSTTRFKASVIAIEVLRRLQQILPNLRVVAFGHELPQGTEFLGENIEFYQEPTQERIRMCYALCDVWLSTSTSEGFNLPALEAMACRTPVVSTKTGWPATAVIDGFNGYGTAVGDIDALYQGVLDVLNADDWECLSRNAFNTASELSWDKSYNLFLDALESIANRHESVAVLG